MKAYMCREEDTAAERERERHTYHSCLLVHLEPNTCSNATTVTSGTRHSMCLSGLMNNDYGVPSMKQMQGIF